LKRVWLRAPAGSTHRCDHHIENNCCLGAAQLTVAPDKTPDSGPAGRAGSFSARRTASRRLQVAPAGLRVSRGKRRAACPQARGCVLRVNRRIVRPAPFSVVRDPREEAHDAAAALRIVIVKMSRFDLRRVKNAVMLDAWAEANAAMGLQFSREASHSAPLVVRRDPHDRTPLARSRRP
jgi:hypothetical protein